MSSRVRYSPASSDTNNVLMSQRTFDVGGVLHRVYLYTLDNTFEIKNDTTNQTVTKGTGSSLHSLKMKAKASLKELGVVFSGEQRAVKVEPTL